MTPWLKAIWGSATRMARVWRRIMWTQQSGIAEPPSRMTGRLKAIWACATPRAKAWERIVGEAVKWWRKAAEQNFAMPQYNLGCCYEYAEGVAKDFPEAYQLYK